MTSGESWEGVSNMAQFEINENGVVWTNGHIGAILEDCESQWKPFRYFNNGNLDVCDEEFSSASEAFKEAVKLFS